MKCEDEMVEFCIATDVVTRMNPIHLFERAYPCRVDDFKNPVWMETPCSQRMTVKRLIIWWTEVVGMWAHKRDGGNDIGIRCNVIAKHEFIITREHHGH